MASTTTSGVPRPTFQRVYFQDGLFLTVLLSGMLFFLLAISLDAAGHVKEGLGILMPVTLGSILVSSLMAFSRFDSFFAFSHSMFAGLAWILFLMGRNVAQADLQPFLEKGISEMQGRAYLILLRLLEWVDAARTHGVSADNTVFIFEIALLVWWLTYLGIWSILRHGYTWRAVVPAGLILVINTYYAPQPVMTLLFVFALVSMALLIRTNLAEQQLRWREGRIHFSQDIGWDFMRNGLYYSLLVLALATTVPNLGSNPLVATLMQPVDTRWRDFQEDVVQPLYSNLTRRPSDESPTFGSSLELGGARSVGNSILFDVQAIQPRYWRAIVYDTYTGRSWRNTFNTTTSFNAGDLLPIPEWENRITISQTITLLAPMGKLVIGPPDIRQTSLPLEATYTAAPAPPQFASRLVEGSEEYGVEWIGTQTDRDLEPNATYIVVSSATQATDTPLRNAGEEYPQQILDHYLSLPETFSPRVKETALEITAGASTPYDKAKAVEGYLRQIPYNDAIQPPPAGADPVEYFLYEIKEGYCDYYATSMAVMMRSLGVPARVVSGYAMGTYDDESGRYYVTEHDAHSWVEVFFPKLGWIEFEPTGGGVGQLPLERPDQQVNVDTVLPDAGQNQPDREQIPSGAPEQPQDLLLPNPDELSGAAPNQFSILPAWAWLLLSLLVLAGGLMLLRRFRIIGPDAFTAHPAPILFERLQRWTNRLRIDAPDHMTPYEQAKHLSFALPEATQPIDTITQSYVRYRFAPQADAQTATQRVNNAAEQTRLTQAWTQLSPILWKKWLTQWFSLRKINGQEVELTTERRRTRR